MAELIHAEVSRGPNPAAAALALGTMAGLWILLVASLRSHEMLVGAISVALAASFLWMVVGAEASRPKYRARDLLECWRIPWYVVSGVWEIVALLFADLFGRPAGSLFRVAGFKTKKDDEHERARRALATAYTTVAPNFIVLGVDVAQSRMLFHQLKRSSVPKMTKRLGAQG